MIRLREIEKRDLDKIKMWHNDLKLSENLGGYTDLSTMM